MKYSLSSEKERFLKLAIKAILGTASQDEQRQLNGLMEAQPMLRKEFSRLEEDFKLDEAALPQDEKSARAELYLRVLFGCAWPEEEASIRAMKVSDPKHWREFLGLGCLLQIIGESAQVPESGGKAPEPMPEAVKKRLTTHTQQLL